MNTFDNLASHVARMIEKQELRRKNILEEKHTYQGTTTYSTKPHPTIPLTLHGKEIDIDIEIAPVILWLNNLPQTHTIYCCQGELARPNHHKPYVIFTTDSQHSLAYILKIFEDFRNEHSELNVSTHHHYIKTEAQYFENKIRYTAHWHDLLALNDFILWHPSLRELKGLPPYESYT